MQGILGCAFIHHQTPPRLTDRIERTDRKDTSASLRPSSDGMKKPETGKLLTIIVGSLPLYDFDDNDIATETAITSAVGTKHLARQDCRVMGLYGTGRQARRHLKVMCALRPIETVKVFSRSADHRRAFCALMQPHI